MQEKYPLNQETSYNKDEDFNDKQTNLIDDDKSDEFSNILDEEMAEPELMFICKDDNEATSLLKKCSKMANEQNFTTLKNYLNELNDANQNINNLDGKINAQAFIKFFYLGVSNFKLKNYQDALNNFVEAHKIHQHYQLNYNIALCYIKLGNLENAVFYLEAVTKKIKISFLHIII